MAGCGRRVSARTTSGMQLHRPWVVDKPWLGPAEQEPVATPPILRCMVLAGEAAAIGGGSGITKTARKQAAMLVLRKLVWRRAFRMVVAKRRRSASAEAGGAGRLSSCLPFGFLRWRPCLRGRGPRSQ